MFMEEKTEVLLNMLQKNYDITLSEFYSRGELISSLELCKNGWAFLDCSEYDNRFLLIKYSPSCRSEWFGIGFWCSNFVFSPQIAIANDTITICFDNYIVAFDMKTNTELFVKTLAYPIESLEYYQNSIIAISELDMVQMNYYGDVLSEIPFDGSLNSYSIGDGKIIVCTERGHTEIKTENSL